MKKTFSLLLLVLVFAANLSACPAHKDGHGDSKDKQQQQPAK